MKLFIKETKESREKDVVVLSAERCTLTEETNKINTELCEALIKVNRIPYSKGEGCYCGDCETSFICVPESEQQQEMLFFIAGMFDQESVLVRTDGVVKLVFVELLLTDQDLDDITEKTLVASSKPIGKHFIPVPMEEALIHEAYTIMNGVAYVVK
jgi:hypothetical protein